MKAAQTAAIMSSAKRTKGKQGRHTDDDTRDCACLELILGSRLDHGVARTCVRYLQEEDECPTEYQDNLNACARAPAKGSRHRRAR